MRRSLIATVARELLLALVFVVALILLIPALVLALPFVIAASSTRLLRRLLERQPEAVPWRELVQYEPLIGWRPRANLDVFGQADEPFRLTTGPDGWRGRLPLADADVVVFGDSFAFGHAAGDDHMYSAFSRGLRVKPIGSDGYNMVHGLLWMRRLAAQLSGKLVVWFVYNGNDLHENLLPNMGRYRMPFVRQRADQDDWELVTDHVSPEPWPIHTSVGYQKSLAELSCDTPLSRRVFSACDYLIREAHVTCDEVGARLAVVSIPMRAQITRRGQADLYRMAADRRTFDVGRPDKMLQESCHRLGARFLPLRSHLRSQDYLIRDIHWNEKGHRRVGGLLADLHADHLSRQASTPPARSRV